MRDLSRRRPTPVFLSTDPTKTERGFTLIEVVLVLTLVSTLLASTISLVAIVKRSDRQASQSFQTRQDIRRFADDFRRDVRRGGDVQIKGNDVVITNEREPSEITYDIQPGSIIDRVVSNSGKKSAANETYQLGIEAEVEWLEKDRLIQWTITETNRESPPLVIAAALRNSSR